MAVLTAGWIRAQIDLLSANAVWGNKTTLSVDTTGGILMFFVAATNLDGARQ